MKKINSGSCVVSRPINRSAVKPFGRMAMALLLAIVMVVQPLGLFAQNSAVTATNTGAIADATAYSSHWASDYIAALTMHGIVIGDEHGNINPDRNITRAEFVTVINRAAGLDGVGGLVGFGSMVGTEAGGVEGDSGVYAEADDADASSGVGISSGFEPELGFTDVAYGQWYYAQFAIASRAGIMVGDSYGNANPAANITRAEAATMLARVMNMCCVFDDAEVGSAVQGSSQVALLGGNANEQESGYDTKAGGIANEDGHATLLGGNANEQESDYSIQAGSIAGETVQVTLLSGTAHTQGATFADFAYIPYWASSSIAQMADAGVITGFPNGYFKPSREMTRAEGFAMITRMLNDGLLPHAPNAGGLNYDASHDANHGINHDTNHDAETNGESYDNLEYGYGLLSLTPPVGDGAIGGDNAGNNDNSEDNNDNADSNNNGDGNSGSDDNSSNNNNNNNNNAPGNGNNSGNNSGNDGNNTQPGSAPYIHILTPFPSGVVEFSHIDITYTAVPTPGAVITEIFYTINGGPPTYIYLSAASGFTPRGELGTARVFITPQPNNLFVFTMRDNAGGEVSYIVQNRPTLGGWFFSQSQDLAYVYWLNDDIFVNSDRLLMSVPWDNGPTVTPAEVAAFFAPLGGTIIGQRAITGGYTIGFDRLRTYAELIELAEWLMSEHPDIVSYAQPNHGTINLNLVVNECEDILVTPAPEVQDSNSFRNFAGYNVPTRDPFWGELYNNPQSIFHQYPKDWGQHAINLPAAWAEFEGLPQRRVRVGVIDTWFNRLHPDLDIPRTNIYSMFNHQGNQHGSGVMAIIAAEHNDINLAGVVDLNRNQVFGVSLYNFSAENHVDALFWLVVHGAQVINVSLAPLDNTRIANDEMYSLLNVGYDFIVVQAVPNQDILASFDTVVYGDSRIRNRVITVTSSTRDGEITHNAAWGGMVDIAAPGRGIYTLSEYGSRTATGTSFVTPFVSGVAALAWSHNPGLTGANIRRVVIDSANIEVIDVRTGGGRPRRYSQVNAHNAIQYAINRAPSHMDGTLMGYVVRARREFTFLPPTNILGSPIPSARVTLYPIWNSSAQVTTITCAQGFFSIPNLQMGMYNLTISPAGYVPVSRIVNIDSVGVVTHIGYIHLVRAGTGRVGGAILQGVTARGMYMPDMPYLATGAAISVGVQGQNNGALQNNSTAQSNGIEQNDGTTQRNGTLRNGGTAQGNGTAQNYGAAQGDSAAQNIPDKQYNFANTIGVDNYATTGSAITPIPAQTSTPVQVPVTLTFRPAYDEQGNPLAHGEGQVIHTVTATGGMYNVAMPAGFYNVTATAAGFVPTTRRVVSFGGYDWLEQDIILQPDVVADVGGWQHIGAGIAANYIVHIGGQFVAYVTRPNQSQFQPRLTTIYTSPDGVTWTYTGQHVSSLTYLMYGNGAVIVRARGNSAYRAERFFYNCRGNWQRTSREFVDTYQVSRDGINFASIQAMPTELIAPFPFQDPNFRPDLIANGYCLRCHLEALLDIALTVPSNDFRTVRFVDGMFHAIAGTRSSLYDMNYARMHFTSLDGVTWSGTIGYSPTVRIAMGSVGGMNDSLYYFNGRLVHVLNPPSNTQRIFSSSDLVHWDYIGTTAGLSVAKNTIHAFGMVYGSGTTSSTTRPWRFTEDGFNGLDLTTPYFSRVDGLVYVNGILIATGLETYFVGSIRRMEVRSAATRDGVNWVQLPVNRPSNISAERSPIRMLVYYNGAVYGYCRNGSWATRISMADVELALRQVGL